jgi:hypothetical protein
VTDPFFARGSVSTVLWDMTIGNCARDLIKVVDISMHTNQAGSIGPPEPEDKVWAVTGKDADAKLLWGEVAARYRLRYNNKHLAPTRYATLAHELAHLYCGHLGTPDKTWWPDRPGLGKSVKEFEAESVAYLICRRLNIDNPSARYLSGYLEQPNQTPAISLERVFRATQTIELMGQKKSPPRKLGPRPSRSRKTSAPPSA